MCANHPKVLTSKKFGSPLCLFGLKSVPRFVIFVGRIKPIACLVFYLVIKLWEDLYKKPFHTWKTLVKIFKKHKNVPSGTHKKRQILFHRFSGECTLFLPPPSSFL